MAGSLISENFVWQSSSFRGVAAVMNLSVLRKVLLVIPVLLVIGLGTGCYNAKTGDTSVYGIAEFKLPVIPKTGSHKVMVFSEMHYQRSFRSQDVPRILPHKDSVPFEGMGGPEISIDSTLIKKEIVFNSLKEYSPKVIPSGVLESYDHEQVAEIFRVNCSVCHGLSREGDGPVSNLMKAKGLGPLPANLKDQNTLKSTDGDLFAFISHGGRQGFALIEKGLESRSPMPEFRYLLTEHDRWALVKYLRSH